MPNHEPLAPQCCEIRVRTLDELWDARARALDLVMVTRRPVIIVAELPSGDPLTEVVGLDEAARFTGLFLDYARRASEEELQASEALAALHKSAWALAFEIPVHWRWVAKGRGKLDAIPLPVMFGLIGDPYAIEEIMESALREAEKRGLVSVREEPREYPGEPRNGWASLAIGINGLSLFEAAAELAILLDRLEAEDGRKRSS